jgi:hypothetical protein
MHSTKKHYATIRRDTKWKHVYDALDGVKEVYYGANNNMNSSNDTKECYVGEQWSLGRSPQVNTILQLTP